MLRNNKTEKEKELLRLDREFCELYKQNKGYFVAVEPYQQGWYRYFVLRDDIRNRKDAQEIRQVLDLINEYYFCSRKDFTERDYRAGKKKRKPIVQRVKTLTEKAYEKLNEKHKSFFSPFISWNKYSRLDEVKYMFKYEYWFVFEIVPRMITKHWITDGEWATRVAELRNKIERDNLWPKIYKARGQRYNYHYISEERAKYRIGEHDNQLEEDNIPE